MRILSPLLIAALAAGSFAAVPADAHKRKYRHSTHRSTAEQRYQDCRADKRRSGHQGIAVGAVAGGVGTALLGGNVGTSLLGAAAGGTAGNFIGRGSPHRCSEGRY